MAKKDKDTPKQEPAKKGKAPRSGTPGPTGKHKGSTRTCGKPCPVFDGYAVLPTGGSCSRLDGHSGPCGT